MNHEDNVQKHGGKGWPQKWRATYVFAIRQPTMVTTLTNDDNAKITLKRRNYHAPYWSFILLLDLCVRFHIMTNRRIQIWNLLPQNIVFLGAQRPKSVKVFFYVSSCHDTKYTYLPAETISKLHLLQELLLFVTEPVVLFRRGPLRIKRQCTNKYSWHKQSKNSRAKTDN